jgi:DNA-binding IclR family transcriptional regulator
MDGSKYEMSSDSMGSPSTNKAVVRILRVLDCIVAHPERRFGPSDISRLLGMTKSMVLRALATLVEEGFIVRSPAGGHYELGYRVLELADNSLDEPDLREVCRSYMQQMSDLTDGTVVLWIPVGGHAVCIDGLEGRGRVLYKLELGRQYPLNAGLHGRAILAALPDNEVDTFIRRHSPMPRLTARTIVEPDELWRELRKIRRSGYAMGVGDSMTSVFGAAFPVLDAEGRPHGAIGVGGPLEQFSEAKFVRFIPRLLEIMRYLNTRTSLLHAPPAFELDTPMTSA